MSSAAGVVLSNFCSHKLFTALLLDAEYAFYWNMFSNSLLARLCNGLPIFFFDIGHLDLTPGLLKLAVRHYFRGWQPVCLDQRQELAIPILRILDSVSQDPRNRVREHLRSSPSPEQVIASILGRRPKTVSDTERLRAGERKAVSEKEIKLRQTI